MDDPKAWISAAIERDRAVVARYRKSYRAPEARGVAEDFYRALSVEIRDGGLTVLEHPGEPFVVEVQYQQRPGRVFTSAMTTTLRAAGERGSGADLTEVRLRAKDGESLSLSAGSLRFLWRYLLAASEYVGYVQEQGSWARLPRRRPRRGKAMDIGFYLKVLSDSEALAATGSAAPARDVAERYGVNRNTVRSWLKRAREIRDKGNDERMK